MRRIANLLISLKKITDQNLNEFVKWVFILGLYVFYRMFEKIYDENQLSFLVIPIIFIGICLFILQWVLPPMIHLFQLSDKETSFSKIEKSLAFIVPGLFALSILAFIAFYLNKNVVMINLGFLSLLASAIIAIYFQKRESKRFGNWFFGYSLILGLSGIAGLIFSIINNNGINAISFVFYVGFIIFYFLINSGNNKKLNTDQTNEES